MPRVFKVGSYWVYFWTNESHPLEPIHVHISQGAPHANAPKVWITSRGGCLLAGRQNEIPDRVLRNIMAIIEARSDEVTKNTLSFLVICHVSLSLSLIPIAYTG